MNLNQGFVGVAPGTPTIQLGDGRTVQVADYVDDKHHATVEFQASDTTGLDAFAQARGQAINGGTRTTTRVDINIPRNGSNGLPPAWEFYVYSLAIEVMRVCRLNNPATASQGMGDTLVTGETVSPSLDSYSNVPTFETLFQLNRRLYVEYKYNGRIAVEGLLGDFPSGAGWSVFTTRTLQSIANNGMQSPHDRVTLTLPIEEREGLMYQCIMTPESALRIGQNAADESTALTFVDIRAKKFGIIRKNV
jgi:hypothetical protein